MDKIIIKTENAAALDAICRTMHAGYEPFCQVSPEEIPALCASRSDIHGVILDAVPAFRELVGQIRKAIHDPLFPVLLISGDMSAEETDSWVWLGVSEILHMPMPIPLLAKRIDNVVRLFCISRNLIDQSLDRLTGLRNRHAFCHYARQMMLEAPEASYTIILSDIENFRLINERFGEERGDELLRYVGGTLAALNGKDMLFARYGGDQFVGIIKRPAPEEGQEEAPLMDGMDFLYANAPLKHFVVKFGIYDNVDKKLPISIMCDRAAMALRSVKHQYGRTMAKYSSQMQQKFNREQRILDSMEDALAQEQFQVYYQPKHDIRNSKIVGMEALVRWIHPAYGFMSPGEFIPLFERSGFISKLDHYVWEHVCADVSGWVAQGFPVVPVSVNASRRDLLLDGFLPSVWDALSEYSVDPRYFHMEITESIYMEDAEILSPIMQQLRQKGIQIELDDFGSGFSSFGILNKLPLDVIKLDISLVRNIEEQPLIVESIIQLMHTLGYRVVAEGAETEAQIDLLREMNCDWVQGYYYSKPLTRSGLEEYMRNYNTVENA